MILAAHRANPSPGVGGAAVKAIALGRGRFYCRAASLPRSEISAIGGDPIRRDGALRLGQRQVAGADLVMEEFFEIVLARRIPRLGVEGFRPEILAHIGAAEAERDQMIDLVMPMPPADVVLAINERLKITRGMPHRARVM